MMSRRYQRAIRRLVALTVFGLMITSSAAAMAQGGAAAETTIHGGTLVIVAYITLWVMFGAVVIAALRRQNQLRRELDGLESRIDEVLGTTVEE